MEHPLLRATFCPFDEDQDRRDRRIPSDAPR